MNLTAVVYCLALRKEEKGISRSEALFRDRIGIPYALAVNSATAGLHLAHLALGIGPGDEVIVQ